MMRTIACCLGLLSRVCLVSTAFVCVASAQYSRQPLVLVHGFFSGGDSWGNTPDYFQTNLYTTVYSWSLGWDYPMLQQAQGLRDRMSAAGLPDTSILVAHSIGGLTARSAATQRPVKGILTIGTSHHGFHIADAVLHGTILGYANLIAGTATQALYDYNYPGDGASPDCFMEDDPNFCDGEIWYARTAGTIAQYIGAVVGTIPLAFVGDGALHSGGSLPDIEPGSPFVAALNTSDNLYRESVFIPHRVSLQSRYTGWASAIWAVGSPGGAPYMTSLTATAISELLFAADYYRNYSQWDDPDYFSKTYFWQDWLWAGSALAGLDQAWCDFTGEVTDVTGCVGDGLVSLADQSWTGSGAITDEIIGPVHTEEKGSGQLQSKAYFYLTNEFHVRTGAPTSGVAASITGPVPTMPGYYTYTAVPSGGNGTFTYSWQMSVDGSSYWTTAVTDQSMTVYLDYNNPLWIRVIVSSGGAQGSADRFLPAFSQCGVLIAC